MMIQADCGRLRSHPQKSLSSSVVFRPVPFVVLPGLAACWLPWELVSCPLGLDGGISVVQLERLGFRIHLEVVLDALPCVGPIPGLAE